MICVGFKEEKNRNKVDEGVDERWRMTECSG